MTDRPPGDQAVEEEQRAPFLDAVAAHGTVAASAPLMLAGGFSQTPADKQDGMGGRSVTTMNKTRGRLDPRDPMTPFSHFTFSGLSMEHPGKEHSGQTFQSVSLTRRHSLGGYHRNDDSYTGGGRVKKQMSFTPYGDDENGSIGSESSPVNIGLPPQVLSTVPRAVLEPYLKQPHFPIPVGSNGFGAIFFADITGYTSLTERFSRYFSQMLDILSDHGGDTIKFAGDALMVLFTPQKTDPYRNAVRRQQTRLLGAQQGASSPSAAAATTAAAAENETITAQQESGRRQGNSDTGFESPGHTQNAVEGEGGKKDKEGEGGTTGDSGGRETWGQGGGGEGGSSPFISGMTEQQICVLRAVQCAVMMQNLCGHYVADDVRLTFKAAIVSGDVSTLHIGEPGFQIEFLLAGPPLKRLDPVVRACESGAVCLDEESHELLRSFELLEVEVLDIPVTKGEDDGEKVKVANVRQLLAAVPQVPLRTLSEENDRIRLAVQKYIKKPIRAQIEGGGVPMLPEFRLGSVFFMNISSGLDLMTEKADVLRAHHTLCEIQRVMKKHRGFLHQFLAEDKGVTLIGVFGVASFYHANNSLTACKCALELKASLTSMFDPPITVSFGITTGSFFSGAVGSGLRQEYTVVGDTVNRAARLAGLAGSPLPRREVAAPPPSTDVSAEKGEGGKGKAAKAVLPQAPTGSYTGAVVLDEPTFNRLRGSGLPGARVVYLGAVSLKGSALPTKIWGLKAKPGTGGAGAGVGELDTNTMRSFWKTPKDRERTGRDGGASVREPEAQPEISIIGGLLSPSGGLEKFSSFNDHSEARGGDGGAMGGASSLKYNGLSGAGSVIRAGKLVGREVELRAITDLLEELEILPDFSGAVILTGESGIGKSRLQEEVRRLWSQRGLYLRVLVPPPERGSAFFVWRQIFSALGISGEESGMLGSALDAMRAGGDFEVEDLMRRTSQKEDVQTAEGGGENEDSAVSRRPTQLFSAVDAYNEDIEKEGGVKERRLSFDDGVNEDEKSPAGSSGRGKVEQREGERRENDAVERPVQESEGGDAGGPAPSSGSNAVADASAAGSSPAPPSKATSSLSPRPLSLPPIPSARTPEASSAGAGGGGGLKSVPEEHSVHHGRGGGGGSSARVAAVQSRQKQQPQIAQQQPERPTHPRGSVSEVPEALAEIRKALGSSVTDAKMGGEAPRNEPLGRAERLHKTLLQLAPKIQLLSPEARNQVVEECMLHMLSGWLAERGKPLLLALEDSHNMDTLSWQLLVRLLKEEVLVAPLLVLLSLTPDDKSGIKDHKALSEIRELPSVQEMRIGPLNKTQCAQLTCSLLKCSTLDDGILEIVMTKGEGVPLFIEEIVQHLKDSELVKFEEPMQVRNERKDNPFSLRGTRRNRHRRAVLTLPALAGHQGTIPISLASSLASRVDRLPHHAQVVLKVASIIGRTFDEETLFDLRRVFADAERSLQRREALARPSTYVKRGRRSRASISGAMNGDGEVDGHTSEYGSPSRGRDSLITTRAQPAAAASLGLTLIPDEEIKSALKVASVAALIVPVGGNFYEFKHNMIHDAVYDLMLPSQTKQLHESVGSWLESKCNAQSPESVEELERAPVPSTATPRCEVLALHFQKARNAVKAAFYLEMAGLKALSAGREAEAIEFFKDLVSLAQTKTAVAGCSATLRARWFLSLGKSFVRHGLVGSKPEGVLYEAIIILDAEKPVGVRNLVAFMREASHWITPDAPPQGSCWCCPSNAPTRQRMVTERRRRADKRVSATSTPDPPVPPPPAAGFSMDEILDSSNREGGARNGTASQGAMATGQQQPQTVETFVPTSVSRSTTKLFPLRFGTAQSDKDGHLKFEGASSERLRMLASVYAVLSENALRTGNFEETIGSFFHAVKLYRQHPSILQEHADVVLPIASSGVLFAMLGKDRLVDACHREALSLCRAWSLPAYRVAEAYLLHAVAMATLGKSPEAVNAEESMYRALKSRPTREDTADSDNDNVKFFGLNLSALLLHILGPCSPSFPEGYVERIEVFGLRCLEHADRESDLNERMSACWMLCTAAFLKDNPSASAGVFQRCQRALYTRLSELSTLSQLQAAHAVVLHLLMVGDLEGALDTLTTHLLPKIPADPHFLVHCAWLATAADVLIEAIMLLRSKRSQHQQHIALTQQPSIVRPKVIPEGSKQQPNTPPKSPGVATLPNGTPMVAEEPENAVLAPLALPTNLAAGPSFGGVQESRGSGQQMHKMGTFYASPFSFNETTLSPADLSPFRVSQGPHRYKDLGSRLFSFGSILSGTFVEREGQRTQDMDEFNTGGPIRRSTSLHHRGKRGSRAEEREEDDEEESKTDLLPAPSSSNPGGPNRSSLSDAMQLVSFSLEGKAAMAEEASKPVVHLQVPPATKPAPPSSPIPPIPKGDESSPTFSNSPEGPAIANMAQLGQILGVKYGVGAAGEANGSKPAIPPQTSPVSAPTSPPVAPVSPPVVSLVAPTQFGQKKNRPAEGFLPPLSSAPHLAKSTGGLPNLWKTSAMVSLTSSPVKSPQFGGSRGSIVKSHSDLTVKGREQKEGSIDETPDPQSLPTSPIMGSGSRRASLPADALLCQDPRVGSAAAGAGVGWTPPGTATASGLLAVGSGTGPDGIGGGDSNRLLPSAASLGMAAASAGYSPSIPASASVSVTAAAAAAAGAGANSAPQASSTKMASTPASNQPLSPQIGGGGRRRTLLQQLVSGPLSALRSGLRGDEEAAHLERLTSILKTMGRLGQRARCVQAYHLFYTAQFHALQAEGSGSGSTHRAHRRKALSELSAALTLANRYKLPVLRGQILQRMGVLSSSPRLLQKAADAFSGAQVPIFLRITYDILRSLETSLGIRKMDSFEGSLGGEDDELSSSEGEGANGSPSSRDLAAKKGTKFEQWFKKRLWRWKRKGKAQPAIEAPAASPAHSPQRPPTLPLQNPSDPTPGGIVRKTTRFSSEAIVKDGPTPGTTSRIGNGNEGASGSGRRAEEDREGDEEGEGRATPSGVTFDHDLSDVLGAPETEALLNEAFENLGGG
uniref:Guanylate cyclase domain-containing protein n=1 Tax=Chromera velia CCMP2878 TaxID=1169474 RepID=A0A0G4FS71_9ALVE|eukprot:Cvel_18343.t1-p1 / transcript=Cvel_18343.t1 / gene=Cvel_18343 / organism=Chromera_velia_CCMP2878 / gene_product=Adenylate cyclase type 10, putative / transcript_product=Adenylate cyclase type 10, putative / location=Cvel_scaffold1515:10634-25293(+) / protein_length=3028 / sequence_SO=supercontig / SO=protein_coding / is_pseudo=false